MAVGMRPSALLTKQAGASLRRSAWLAACAKLVTAGVPVCLCANLDVIDMLNGALTDLPGVAFSVSRVQAAAASAAAAAAAAYGRGLPCWPATAAARLAARAVANQAAAE